MIKSLLKLPIRTFAKLTNREALNKALDEELEANDKVFLIG